MSLVLFAGLLVGQPVLVLPAPEQEKKVTESKTTESKTTQSKTTETPAPAPAPAALPPEGRVISSVVVPCPQPVVCYQPAPRRCCLGGLLHKICHPCGGGFLGGGYSSGGGGCHSSFGFCH